MGRSRQQQSFTISACHLCGPVEAMCPIGFCPVKSCVALVSSQVGHDADKVKGLACRRLGHC